MNTTIAVSHSPSSGSRARSRRRSPGRRNERQGVDVRPSPRFGEPKDPGAAQMCANPSEQHGCAPLRHHLRRAIKHAVERPILWVDQRRRHAGVFWVLGPVRFEDGRASIRSAWREQGTHGCFGSNVDRFRWTEANNEWNHTGGSGSSAAPEVAAATWLSG